MSKREELQVEAWHGLLLLSILSGSLNIRGFFAHESMAWRKFLSKQ